MAALAQAQSATHSDVDILHRGFDETDENFVRFEDCIQGDQPYRGFVSDDRVWQWTGRRLRQRSNGRVVGSAQCHRRLLIRTRRRDKVTRTAITANQPDALVIYVAQTADPRKALEVFDRNRVLEWAAALAVTSAGVSLWQSSRAGSSERLFNLRWSEIQQVRIVLIPVGRYKTAALELSSVVKPEHHLIVPFSVRPRFGSVIGLGLGPRIEAIEAKIQGLRGASR